MLSTDRGSGVSMSTGCYAVSVPLPDANNETAMSAVGHSRPGPAGRRSSNVRYAPKATVGHQNAIGRDGPQADIRVDCYTERKAPGHCQGFRCQNVVLAVSAERSYSATSGSFSPSVF
jgi:hypothetical protein